MSRLDDELAEAVNEAAAVAVAAPVAPAVHAERKRRNMGLLIGVLAIGGGMLMLVMTSFDGSGSWARTVQQVVSDKDSLVGRNVKVSGALVKGSLRKRDDPCEYRFELTELNGKGATLPVRYEGCVVPDTFRDVPGMDVEVTADGKVDPAGHFQASQIMAKCPSKYEMQERAKKGEQAPHQAISPTEPAKY
jgi:cytochrome c-type biogenesis protein CcmE